MELLKKNYWDKIAKNKDYYFGDYNNEARLLALKLIKDKESFLDVGCGTGMMYELLMKNKREVFYKGIDYSYKMIENCQERWKGATCFEQMDVKDLQKIEDNSYDIVYMRHCLENCRDWRETIKQMFRICRKRVIMDLRRPFVNTESKVLEDHDDTVCWDINYDEFNIFCRNLTVNVSYLQQPIGDSNTIVVMGKAMDEVVFTLDDFHETNHNLNLLLDLKEKFPKMKVTLFVIPSKCSVEWLKDLKEKYGEWMRFCPHGYLHDVSRREYSGECLYPEECLMWTEEDANKYLQKAEDMGVFIKGFKAPGWGMNEATFKVLYERDYWVMDNKDRINERPDWVNNNFESGHLWEVNGHIQETPFNGLETMIRHKLNFGKDSNFYFVSEVYGTEKNKQRLINLI